MRSLLDSFIEFEHDQAAFSILKLGKRFLCLLEETTTDGERLVRIIGFVKTPLLSLLENTSLDEIKEAKRLNPGFIIYHEMILETNANKKVIQEILNAMEILNDVALIHWSSSYLISREKLDLVLSIIRQNQDNPPQYNSVNYNVKNNTGYDNKMWILQVLRQAQLNFSLPLDENDPTSYKEIPILDVFSSGKNHDDKLLEAAYNNDLTQVEHAIRLGANVNSFVDSGILSRRSWTHGGMYNYNGFSALMFAVCRRNKGMIRYLVQNKADTDLIVKINDQPFSAMDFAIILNLPMEVLAIFYDLDAKYHFSLSHATQRNHEAIRLLNLTDFEYFRGQNAYSTQNHSVRAAQLPSMDSKSDDASSVSNSVAMFGAPTATPQNKDSSDNQFYEDAREKNGMLIAEPKQEAAIDAQKISYRGSMFPPSLSEEEALVQNNSSITQGQEKNLETAETIEERKPSEKMNEEVEVHDEQVTYTPGK